MVNFMTFKLKKYEVAKILHIDKKRSASDTRGIDLFDEISFTPSNNKVTYFFI